MIAADKILADFGHRSPGVLGLTSVDPSTLGRKTLYELASLKYCYNVQYGALSFLLSLLLQLVRIVLHHKSLNLDVMHRSSPVRDSHPSPNENAQMRIF